MPDDQIPLHRSFNSLVYGLEDGDFHNELTVAQQELIQKMNDQFMHAGGKPKGKITITLDFKMDGGVVEVVSDFKIVAPKSPRSKTVLWATPGGLLTANNPKQFTLGLKEVTVPQQEVKTL